MLNSIHNKYTTVMTLALIICTLFIGGIGITTTQEVIDRDSVQLMSFLCAKEAQEINDTLGRIEQSVNIFAVHAINELESVDRLLNDKEYQDSYSHKMVELADTIATETEGATTIFLKFDPAINISNPGFFRIKNTETGIFEYYNTTNLTSYNSESIKAFGWIYDQKKEGKPVWIEPYYNDNIGVELISYVVPIYKDNVMIGFVGIDIDYQIIKNKVDSLSLYYTGYAYLVDNEFKTIYDKTQSNSQVSHTYQEALTVKRDLEENGADTLYSYELDGDEYRVAFAELDNSMKLAVTASLDEIDAVKRQLQVKIIISAIVITFIFWVVSWLMAIPVIRPLKALDKAAKEIANGNLDVQLSYDTNDEVGTLSRSLQETVNQLKKRIEYINSLAYTDKLTGTKNNTSYLYELTNIKDNLNTKLNNLAVFVIDLNGLKHINDKHGHNVGNKLIISASTSLIKVFGEEHVYRVGGDEFIVLLDNASHDICKMLEEKFTKRLSTSSDELFVSAAIGYVIYNPELDSDYEGPFARADENMYKKKLEMKEAGEISKLL